MFWIPMFSWQANVWYFTANTIFFIEMSLFISWAVSQIPLLVCMQWVLISKVWCFLSKFTLTHYFKTSFIVCFTKNTVTVYPKKYAHGFVVLCFVVVMQSFMMNSHEVFIHIHQGCFAGTGAIVKLPQCQWSKPDGYGKISQCITTTKHSKAKTVCIILGIYCNLRHIFWTMWRGTYLLHTPLLSYNYFFTTATNLLVRVHSNI